MDQMGEKQEYTARDADRIRLPFDRQGWYTLTVECEDGENLTMPVQLDIEVMGLPQADLTLPGDLKRIEAGAFAGVGDVTVRVDGAVEWIDATAFEDSVTILAPWDSYAFERCQALGLNVTGY